MTLRQQWNTLTSKVPKSAEAWHDRNALAVNELPALMEENERLLGLLNRDKTGLAEGLTNVRRIACGFDWLCEGRGPYTYDDDRYRMEIGSLITGIVEAADKALHESGARVTEAFHPRAKETNAALLADATPPPTPKEGTPTP